MKVRKNIVLSVLTAGLLVEFISSDPFFGKDQCKDGELYKKEIYRFEDISTPVKLYTELYCKCDRYYVKPRLLSYRDYENITYFPIIYEVNITCPETNQDKLDPCDRRVCQFDMWEDIGEVSPGAKYKDYSDKICDCQDKECKIEEVEEYIITYMCNDLYEEPQNNTCKENAVFRVEYLRETNSTSRSGAKDLEKLNTNFLCKCDTYRNATWPIPSIDPIEENVWILDYQCPPGNPKAVEKACEGRQVCKTYYYKEKGSEYPGELYLDYSLPRCKCSGNLKCMQPIEMNSTTTHRNYTCMQMLNNPINPCEEGDVHKEEIWRNITLGGRSQYYRQGTKFWCNCNVDRHNIKSIVNKDPKRSNIYSIKYKCFEAPQIGNTTCFEHQICKREFKYFYGEDLPDEMYIDTVEEYCNCTEGRECRSFGSLPKERFPEYDAVVTYRCMHREPTILVPCDPDQVFIEEIYRAKEIRDGIPYGQVKLHTFIRCICETVPQQNPTLPDPNDRTQWILNKTCALFSKPDENIECRDKAICRLGFMTNVGVEEIDSYVVERYRIMCKCEVERFTRSCVNMGEIDDRKFEIHQCLPDKVSEGDLKLCAPGQLFKDVISHAIWGHKKNTILYCLCEEFQYKRVNNVTTTLHADDWNINLRIKSYFCPAHPYAVKEDFIPCLDYAVCLKEVYTEYGGDIGAGIKYLRNNFTDCYCNGTRICNVTETDHHELVEGEGVTVNTYRCIPKLKGPSLPLCDRREDEAFLVRVFHKSNTRSSEPVYLNSFPRCLCYASANASFVIVSHGDPLNPSERFEVHICTHGTPDKKYCTEEDQVCIEDLYEKYGRERPGTFLYATEKKCICSINKLCTSVEFHDDATVYRCVPIENRFENFAKVDRQLPRCKADEIYLEEYYYGFDLLNTILKCNCPGEGFRASLTESGEPSNSSITVAYSMCKKLGYPTLESKRNCVPGDACRSETAKLYGYAYEEFYLDYIKINCHCVVKNTYNLTCSEVDLPWRLKKAPRIIESQCQNAKCQTGDTCGAKVFDSKKKFKRNEIYCHCLGELCIDTSNCKKIGEEAYRYQKCAKKRVNVKAKGDCPGVSHLFPYGGG